mgnify:CR=1 FL=1
MVSFFTFATMGRLRTAEDGLIFHFCYHGSTVDHRGPLHTRIARMNFYDGFFTGDWLTLRTRMARTENPSSSYAHGAYGAP